MYWWYELTTTILGLRAFIPDLILFDQGLGRRCLSGVICSSTAGEHVQPIATSNSTVKGAKLNFYDYRVGVRPEDGRV